MSDIKNENESGACNQDNENKEVAKEEKTEDEIEDGGFMSEGATTEKDNRGDNILL